MSRSRPSGPSFSPRTAMPGYPVQGGTAFPAKDAPSDSAKDISTYLNFKGPA